MGNVRDTEKAVNSHCYCKKYTKDGEEVERCWSKGIVGMLSQEQKELYCKDVTKEPLPEKVDTKRLLQEIIPDPRAEKIAKKIGKQ